MRLIIVQSNDWPSESVYCFMYTRRINKKQFNTRIHAIPQCQCHRDMRETSLTHSRHGMKVVIVVLNVSARKRSALTAINQKFQFISTTCTRVWIFMNFLFQLQSNWIWSIVMMDSLLIFIIRGTRNSTSQYYPRDVTRTNCKVTSASLLSN